MSFADFVGQDRIKTRIDLAIAAAKSRQEVLPHILLLGPPGSGKATLAQIIADKIGRVSSVNVKHTVGRAIDRAGELCGMVTSLENGGVLFLEDLDEIDADTLEYLPGRMQ